VRREGVEGEDIAGSEPAGPRQAKANRARRGDPAARAQPGSHASHVSLNLASVSQLGHEGRLDGRRSGVAGARRPGGEGRNQRPRSEPCVVEGQQEWEALQPQPSGAARPGCTDPRRWARFLPRPLPGPSPSILVRFSFDSRFIPLATRSPSEGLARRSPHRTGAQTPHHTTGTPPQRVISRSWVTRGILCSSAVAQMRRSAGSRCDQSNSTARHAIRGVSGKTWNR